MCTMVRTLALLSPHELTIVSCLRELDIPYLPTYHDNITKLKNRNQNKLIFCSEIQTDFPALMNAMGSLLGPSSGDFMRKISVVPTELISGLILN